ncbi:helicase associated domain-containing protein [Streptomyces flaveolus]|uniref:helicase associated domain-containing protein n=1 Tax=Streptomyces flaveolus TaxID=67297 RepID=UPI003699DFB2
MTTWSSPTRTPSVLVRISVNWPESAPPPVTSQPTVHVRIHLDAGEALPTEAGDVVRQGEDLGRWVRAVRQGWDKLTTVQQWLCEQVLGIEPAGEDEKPSPRRTQADTWATNYQAARQFYEREGHLRVPRKHVERIIVDGHGSGGSSEGQVDDYRLPRPGAV